MGRKERKCGEMSGRSKLGICTCRSRSRCAEGRKRLLVMSDRARAVVSFVVWPVLEKDMLLLDWVWRVETAGV